MQRCPKCNSEKLMHNVRIIDRGHNGSITPLEVEVFTKPDAIFFKGSHREALEATICGKCGHTELTVTNPDKLYQAYLESQRNSI
ncbi:MAG: hypothetical protein F6K18_02995 [Okeania sp. SIO2C2]|uniref:hypothetical protein n=1 Tax=Okeania sp. SIO2C2 TaxID=2607787 RepID=UPI0013B79DC7|nr:hypothetical protein [Okeania sp. SIO2C2]NEP85870.1 hypothetical protein [Okeania sp. SIO2C2]